MSLLKLPEVRPPSIPFPVWYETNLYCNYHRVTGHSTDNCFTWRGAIQDLIDRKVIIVNTQEAASTSAPVPAPACAPTSAAQHPNIVSQPLLKHSHSEGAGTSGLHSIFPSGFATSVVDPSILIHLASKPFHLSLYHSAVISSESTIHMI